MKKEKLVRDRIPEIIIAEGKKPIIRDLDNDEYLQVLDKKLNVEIADYQANKSVEEMEDEVYESFYIYSFEQKEAEKEDYV